MYLEPKKARFRKMVLLGIKQFGDPYYQGFAAQIAFYIMLSVVPTIVVMTQLLGVLNISTMEFISSWIDSYITPEMGRIIKGLLRNSSSVSNNIILILLAIWSASRAQFSLMRIANYTYSGSRFTGNFWTERIRSLRTMAMTIITISFVLVVLIYGKTLLYTVVGGLVESYTVTLVWTYARWPVAALLYFLLVLYNYFVMPVEKIKVKDLLPGTLFGALGLVIVTFFYSAYTEHIVNYNIIYGSLSSIVALLFWFYFLSWVLVLGIIINKVYRDTK
ncbi:MAG: YihY/virulence factor BrkB family protein [Hornefia sp.]|nr:YihY/virulence factor BrkB family protein [Hornefia sp.]